MSTVVSQMIDDWNVLRETIRLDEAATTPDLVDGLGRRWVWWKGDLYRHEGKAWTRDLMPGPVVADGAVLECVRCEGSGNPTSFSEVAFLGECVTCDGRGWVRGSARAGVSL